MYLIVRKCDVHFEKTRSILQTVNLLSIPHCHSWLTTFIDEDFNALCIMRDDRGKYRRNQFYETFPFLESQAKSFAFQSATSKTCRFDIYKLASFVNERFKELYPIEAEAFRQEKPFGMIRSVESCRVDLISWGAKWDKNKNRPYFEGHEREDVVTSRNKFVNQFLNNKEMYFSTRRDELGWPYWVIPSSLKKRIVLAHDESTYRSGEQACF